MGSTARIFVVGGPPGLEQSLRARLTALENHWSRFIETSDITRANHADGRPTLVAPDTLLLVDRAITASRLTHGWFDPLLLPQLTAAGYDRSFDTITSTDTPLVATIDCRDGGRRVVVHDWGARCRLITMDATESTLRIPTSHAFDPGGIGKGLAADLLLEDALESGASSIMVDLGGDLAFGGTAPSGGWPIAVENPFAPDHPLCTIRLPWGAVATSSKARRRWVRGNELQHHLIDPNTGSPSNSEVVAATVVAGTCWLAEALAKAVVLAGVDAGRDLLESRGLEGLMIDGAGTVHATDTMADYVDAAAA